MDDAIRSAVAEISSTEDLLERALNPAFNWDEARRLAALPSFGVAAEFKALRGEVENG